MNLKDILGELGLGHLIEIDIFEKKDKKTETKTEIKKASDISQADSDKIDEIARQILKESKDDNWENAETKKERRTYTQAGSMPDNSKMSEKTKSESSLKKILNEEDYVFFKTYKCPICTRDFKNLTAKTGRSRVVSRDWDLRPKYSSIDSLKYDVVHCNYCGYAALTSYFSVLPKAYKELVKINICDNYKPMPDDSGKISYRRAVKKYQLALLNAIARNAKDSEKAMICMKLAWILRGILENEEITDDERAELKENEEHYLNYARVGFEYALANEQQPIAFLDEMTFYILLSSLNKHFGKYNDAVKLLINVIYSKKASSHQKEIAREMVFEIREMLNDRKKV